MEALRASFDAGDLTAEAFAAERRALRDALRADVRAVLPADVAERLDDRADRRRAEREARAQVLALTDEQRGALRALRLDRPGRDRADRNERPTAEERRARHEQVRAARAEAAAVLTTDQRDVIFLHRLLTPRPARRGRAGGRTGEAAPPAPATGALQSSDAPSVLSVDAVAPNPSAGRVRVVYAVPEGGAVRLEVFDVRGRRVLERSEQAAGAGRYTATLDVGDLGPGVYLVRVTADGAAAEVRFTVAR